MAEQFDGPPRDVRVLIDADGYRFHPSLLRKGTRGGVHAALQLERDILAFMRAIKMPDPLRCTIMVELFCGKYNLDRTLVNEGSVQNEATIRSFWHGISAAKKLWTVVDCGELEGATKETLHTRYRRYIRSSETEIILTGCCHDEGYFAKMLEDFRALKAIGRVYLLKADSLAPMFRHLNFPFVEFSDVFLPCSDQVQMEIKIDPEPIQPSWGQVPTIPTATTKMLHEPEQGLERRRSSSPDTE